MHVRDSARVRRGWWWWWAPPLQDQRYGAGWRGMAQDSGAAGREKKNRRVFLLLCKWQLQLVVAAHFRGAGTAPARGLEVRVCTGLALRTSGISGSVSRAQGPDSLRCWYP